MKRSISLLAFGSAFLVGTFAALAGPVNPVPSTPPPNAVETDPSAPLYRSKGAWLGLFLDVWHEARELRSEYPLSAEQKTAIKAVMANYHDEIVLQLEARVSAQRALHAEVNSPSSNEASVRAAAQKLGAVIADGAVLKSKIAREVRPLLTEEQRTALTQLMTDLDSKVDSVLATKL